MADAVPLPLWPPLEAGREAFLALAAILALAYTAKYLGAALANGPSKKSRAVERGHAPGAQPCPAAALGSRAALQPPSRAWLACDLGCCLSRGRESSQEAGDNLDSVPDFFEISRSKTQPSSACTLHPKFCGSRLLAGETGLPRLRHVASPWSLQASPDEWRRCLVESTELERRCCYRLLERVAAEPGPKDAATMIRFLRARRGDVEAAAEMYIRAIRWRTATGLEAALRSGACTGPFTAELALHRSVDSSWPPCGLFGRDFEGDPVYWNRVGNSDVRKLLRLPLEFFLRHESYTTTLLLMALEESAREQGRGLARLTVVVDLADLGIQHTHPSWALLMQKCVRVAEDYYPEMVKRIVLVRAPGIFPTIFQAASRFFDEGTRQKFQVVGPAQTCAALARIMHAQWIPEALGGTRRMGGSSWCDPYIPTGGAPAEKAIEDINTYFAKP